MITNTPECIVKLTHIPTGIVVTSAMDSFSGRRKSLLSLKNNCLKQLKILLQNKDNPEVQEMVKKIEEDSNSKYSWETIIDS